MNKLLLILLVLSSNLSFSQSKVDTINFSYHSADYEKKALSFIEKMIEANIKYGNGRKDLVYNTKDLEIISHPIFTFKKDIKDDIGKKNLINYILFENVPNKQIFEVYFKGKYIYTFELPSHKLTEIEKLKSNKILLGDLSVPETDILGISLDYNYVFRDYFSFYIENTYCVSVNNEVSVITNSAIPKHIKIIDFNNYFFPELNRLKNEAKDFKNLEYEQYKFKGPIKPVVLNVEYNE